MTAVLRELRENLTVTREVYGRRSSQSQAAFEALVRAAAESGHPLDALRRHTRDEVERFFSYTIPGPDGHVYWDGPREFPRNDGTTRRPRRWWWMHAHGGDLTKQEDILANCGERNCINPEHCVKESARKARLLWPPERIIGALQVVAMRKGETPTTTDWEREHHRPTREIVCRAFGSWEKAVAAAGLPPTRGPGAPAGPATVLAAIRLARKVMGTWPTEHNYREARDALVAAGLPSTVSPARRLYGSFLAARIAAGGPGRTVGDSGGGGRSQPTREDCLAAIYLVRERVGRWPTIGDLKGQSAALRAAGLPSSESPFQRIFGTFAAARRAAKRSHASADSSGRESPPSKRKDQ